MSRQRAFGAAAAAVALATATSAGAVQTRTGASDASPKTLVSVHGKIGGFAQDGNRIAWLQPGAPCRDFVQVRNLRTRKQFRLAAKRGATCPPAAGYIEGRLALAGTRALWAVFDESGGNTVVNYAVYVVYGRPGIRDRVTFGFDEEADKDDNGDAPSPDVAMAGDASTLVFAVDGVTRRLVRGRAVRTARIGGTWVLAAAAGKIAVAKQSTPGGCVCNESPSWSPDGSLLVFASGRDNSEAPAAYTMPASGGAPSRVAAGVSPRWSPDGTNLALQDWRGLGAVIVVGSGGGNPVRIDNATDAAWSPDGTHLAFTRTLKSGGAVFVARPDGSETHLLAANAGLADWSPDGSRVALDNSQGGIDVVGADGSNRHTVAARGLTPKWSPDGSRLLFVGGDGLHVISADGTGDSQVTHAGPGETDYDASWSPSGLQVAFVRLIVDNDRNVELERRVWIVNADGTGPRPLATQSDFENEPVWSPSGERVAFVSYGELYVANADGGALAQITNTQPAEASSMGALFGAASGRKLSSFTTAGTVYANAVSHSVAALLVVGKGGGKRIELFDPKTGAARGGVDVDPGTENTLSAAGPRIVFNHGTQIKVLDARTGQVSVVAVAARAPLDLSIEGRRIAWAEHLGKRARIRAGTAP